MGTSSPSRVAGKVTRKIKIAGKEYTLNQPQKVGSFSQTEEFILSKRKDEALFAIHACELTTDRALQTVIFEGATRAARGGMATEEEWAMFEKSPWRRAMLLFQSLDPKHHDEVPDAEAAMKLIEADSNFDRCMEIAAGLLGVVVGEESLGQVLSMLALAQQYAERDGNLDKLLAVLKIVSQDDELKNSPGPTETSGAPQPLPPEGPSSPAGQPSTSGSGNSTDGPPQK